MMCFLRLPLSLRIFCLFCAGNRHLSAQSRLYSGYIGNLARKVHNAAVESEVAYLKELYHRNDPEAVIRLFESRSALHSNPSALSEYVKALVKVDRLDESELLKTLQRGGCEIKIDLFGTTCFCTGFCLIISMFL